MDTNDHEAHRREIIDIAHKYDSILKTITEATDIDEAAACQAATDLLLENIICQLQVECSEQSSLIVRARDSYARIFKLLQRDAAKSRTRIVDLEAANAHLELNLTKVVDNATERVKEAQETAQRQIQQLRKEIDEKKEEYDTSMKRFLEQKAQLEEHVKALHRVFLDFQQDSVYMTLEELKHKLEKAEKKLQGRENDVAQLHLRLTKAGRQVQELEDGRTVLEQANEELRRKLRTAMAHVNRLQREIDLSQVTDAAPRRGEEGQSAREDGPRAPARLGIPDKPLISVEAVMESSRPTQFRRRAPANQVDPVPYIELHQKLMNVGDKLADFVQRHSSHPVVVLNDGGGADIDKIFLSGETRLIMNALEAKVDAVNKFADGLDAVIVGADQGGGSTIPKNMPRFLKYLGAHIVDTDDRVARQVQYGLIRQLFHAKYMCDQWHQRMNRPAMRFPEFIIAWHCKDGENMFSALQKCARLWHSCRGLKVPEVRLFRRFAKEKFSVDELSFFLDVRMGLIGNTKSEEPSVIIPYKQCRVVMEKILGSFSPILQVISGEAEKCVKQGSIDYAEFCFVMLKFYENERRKRRNAVRLMFQSRRFSGGHEWFDFENFIAMIQALGFRGSLDDIFGLFREASLLGDGDVSLDALLMSMDNLSFHFYTIDVPGQWKKPNEVTNVPRSVINRHLGTFMSWFEGFDGVQERFDTWLLAKITAQVTTLDKFQQRGAPVALVYQEYRTLLDWFQYMLNVMSKGMEEPMPAEKAERQLQLLESLIDLLVTAVVGDQNGQVQFTEFE